MAEADTALAADLAAVLRDAAANLRGYIEDEARVAAATIVAEAKWNADQAIQAARGEAQRQQDLVAELRRRADFLSRQQAEATEAKVRIADALGEMPYKQWQLIAAAVECRLAEQDATIERLRLQVLDATKNAQMAEVPLPASAEGDRR